MCSADVVLWCCLKPCWCGASVMFDVLCGRIIFSSDFAMGDRRAMGRYDELFWGSLPGLARGIMLANFQVCGMLFVLIAMLYVCVKYLIAFLPRCFRCCMLILSGPGEFLFLVRLSACFVSLSVM